MFRGNPEEHSSDSEDSSRVRQLKEELADLKAEEHRIGKLTEVAQNMLRVMSEDRQCKEYLFSVLTVCYCRMAFLTQKDIRGIPCFRDDTLLAMKAPFGSTLEVPDPDDVYIGYSAF